MKKFIYSLALVLAVASSASTAVWQPYVEFEGRAGDIIDSGNVNFFTPLKQGPGSLLFADLRAQKDDFSGSQGNWGLAYRRLLDSGWIAGVNGYYDLRETQHKNNFSQGGFGFEALNLTQGARLNFYLPEQGVQGAGAGSGPVTAIFLNNNIFVTGAGAQETAYQGLDFEFEQMLWCDCSPQRLKSGDYTAPFAEVWAAVGGYHFDPSQTGFTDFTGARARTEMRLFDLSMLGNGSRVVLGGQLDYDDLHGSAGTGFVSLRMPLGKANRNRCCRMTWTERRMVDPVRRQTRVVTERAAGGGLEPAINARTGRVINNAIVIDANTANPDQVIQNAGADSVVFVDYTSGDIVFPSQVALSPGQTILGSWADLAVIGAQSGSAATLPGTGVFPSLTTALDFGSNGAFTMADDTALIGLNIETSGANAIQIANSSNVAIDNTLITAANPAAGALITVQDSELAITNTAIEITGNTQEVDAVVMSGISQLSVASTQINNTTPNGDVIVASGNSDIIFNSSVGNSSQGDGVRLSDNATLTMVVSTINGVAGFGLNASDNARILMQGSAFDDVQLSSPGTLHFTAEGSNVVTSTTVVSGPGTVNFSTNNPLSSPVTLNGTGGTINVEQANAAAVSGSTTASGNVLFNQPPPTLP